MASLPHTTQPARLETTTEWVLSSAAILTIATVVGSTVGFLLSMMIGRPDVSAAPDADTLAAMLTRSILLQDLVSGLCVGGAVGVGLMFAGDRFVDWAARRPRLWGATTVLGAGLGVAAAFLVRFFARDLWDAPFLINAASGAVAGLVLGAAQSLALWRTAVSRLRWTGFQACALAAVMVVFFGAERAVASLWLFPLLWLVMWAAYSAVIRMALDDLYYRDPHGA